MSNAELLKTVKSQEQEIKELREMLRARDERHRLDASCLQMVGQHVENINWASSLFNFLAADIERRSEMLEAAVTGRKNV